MKINRLILISAVIIVLTNTTLINSQRIDLNKQESTVVLVIGFGPFLNHPVNPSELIAAELDGEIINNAEIIGLQVQPNLSNFMESSEIFYQAIEDCYPDYIFSIGLAAPFKNIRIEKIGYNLKIENKENTTFKLTKKYVFSFKNTELLNRKISNHSEEMLFYNLALKTSKEYRFFHNLPPEWRAGPIAAN